MGNPVSSPTSNPPSVFSMPDTPTTTNLISVVMDKFQGAMNAKETTLNLQKETLQTIVVDMNFISDKIDSFKNPFIWTDVNSIDLDIDDSVGLKRSDFNLNSPEVPRLITATQTMIDAGIDFGGPDIYRYHLTGDPPGLFYFDTSPAISVRSGIAGLSLPLGTIYYDRGNNYYINMDGENIYYLSSFEGFAVPSSKVELDNWQNFSKYKDALSKTESLLQVADILSRQNINGSLNINYDMAYVKNIGGNTNSLAFPIQAVPPDLKLKQPIGSVFYFSDDISNPKKYFFSKSIGVVDEIPVSDVKPFIFNPSEVEVKSWHTQLAEKQIQLTQRSTEFQAFLNTTVAEFNTYSDLFTNVLKTIFSSLKDIVSKF